MTPTQIAARKAAQRKYYLKRKKEDPAWYERIKAESLERTKRRYRENADVREASYWRNHKKYLELKAQGLHTVIRNKYRNKKRGEPKPDTRKSLAAKAAYQRRRQDPIYRFTQVVATRIRASLGKFKTADVEEMIGCTIMELRAYLESKFEPGMSWENHTNHGWHMDHIKPPKHFDLTDPLQRKAFFHYTNIQPLWGRYNTSKSANAAPKPHIYDPNDCI